MIVVLLNIYIAILATFVWLKFVPLNLFWKISPVIVLLLLLVGLFVPVGWGAPQGPVLAFRNSVQIIPSVSGEVIDMPVAPNVPLKEGDVLFRIDPTTYEAQVHALQAQLQFAELRLAQFSQLQTTGTGRTFDVEQRQSQVDELRAQLEGAKWNLEKTTVQAPADGYVTNLTLRKGARITAQAPVMAFIDTSESLLAAEFPQIYARYIEASQPVEVTFKIFPGEVYAGRVATVLQAISTGQGQPGGLAATPATIETAPFVVKIALDNQSILKRLPAGSTAVAAVFADRVKARHIIRKVMLRQIAILNYINPL